MDKNEDAVSIEGTRARVKVALPGYPEVALEPDKDHFEGKGPPILVDHPSVTIVVEKKGKTETVRLTLHLESGPEGHHHHGEHED